MFSIPSHLVVGLALAGLTRAGTTVWSGSFDQYKTVEDFDTWSFSNPVGAYQWYIHGSGPTSDYLALDASYKNPAVTSEAQGLKMSISSTATWNSDMERAELIPQTKENLGTGTLFYHFSVVRSEENAPDSTLEHQVMFFESHFTELKYGVGDTPTNLSWMVGGQSKWSTDFVAGTWFNFAYEIDFDASTVGLWASTDGADLERVIEPVSASTSTNSADFHIGVLRIVNKDPAEDWYFSGVYIESGDITTAIGNGSSSGSTTSVATSTSAPASTSAEAPATTEVHSSTEIAASSSIAVSSEVPAPSAISTSIAISSVAQSSSAAISTSVAPVSSAVPASSSAAPVSSSAAATTLASSTSVTPSSSSVVEEPTASTESSSSAASTTVEGVTTSTAPVSTSIPTSSTLSAPAPSHTGVVDANVCMNDYNKCIAASQPNPDWTGCEGTKAICMQNATYNFNMINRLKRDGKFGRLLV
ncbi:glycoside hydrolase family 131 protein [Cylindrobasidium torrendii FP15055 ss-10]|uniref:Glycoside hydrolase family 131 protein n=1 Tax=Cylindrobasidium torrendii FP15055 ss-10 TaxID=1314674 RepID=A0A0D7BKR1_9AGAR|nr:glycoside hydrolase family 131 protein [Cylindrobasidium torrendii FP15055 ss-10]